MTTRTQILQYIAGEKSTPGYTWDVQEYLKDDPELQEKLGKKILERAFAEENSFETEQTTKQQGGTKPKCKHCGKALVAIGTDRKNGKNNYSDWQTRQYHKKCLKKL
jgi:hypothetical protein